MNGRKTRTAMQPPKILPLPKTPDDDSRCQGLFWRPNNKFVDDLAGALSGRRVLEIFAGNGYLSAWLASKGVNIVATSILSGMDAHAKGVYCPVIDMDAICAVKAFSKETDTLLICWPTVTEDVTAAAALWGKERDIVFIGEVTEYSKGHLGGCATDSFFEQSEIVAEIPSYQGNMLEKAMILRHIGPNPNAATNARWGGLDEPMAIKGKKPVKQRRA